MFKKKIVKFFTKTFVGKVADNVLGSPIKSTVEKTSRTNEGKADWKEMIAQFFSSTLPYLILLYLFVKGLISIKDLLKISEMFGG